MIGMYFESWAMPWVSSAEVSSLAVLEPEIDIVYLSFVKPDCEYRKNSASWSGTGLQFSPSFDVVKKSIAILQKKSVKVLLAVGGATYHNFSKYNLSNIKDLHDDLQLDGIDIDWEPANGISNAGDFGPIIKRTRDTFPKHMVTAAVFAHGVLPPASFNIYRGINTKGLAEQGSLLDLINIMAYDGGKDLDVMASYKSYKNVFSKPVAVGFQTGKQGWGDALLSLADVKTICEQLKNTGDGCFVWAYFKDGSPSPKEVVKVANKILASLPSLPLSKIILQLEKVLEELKAL